jgi:small-conductance mechanosensitive channel
MRAILALLLIILSVPAAAQAPNRTDAATATIMSATTELRRIDQAFDASAGSEVQVRLRDRVSAVRQQADDAVTTLTPELTLIDARIAELGPKPATPEAPDIAAQRRTLTAQRSAIDGAIKRGRLLSVEATQLADEIVGAQAERFGEHVSERVASPLSPALWADIWRDLPRDGRRVARFADEAGTIFLRAAAGPKLWVMLVGALLAVLLAFPVRIWLRRAGRRYAIASAPGSRARRTGLALWFLLVGTLSNAFAATGLVQGLRWAGALSPRADALAQTFLFGSILAAFMISLGGCLLLRRQPSWRLLPIGDDAATALRPHSWAVGLITLAAAMTTSANRVLAMSTSARVAAEGAIALAYALLIMATLVTIARLRAAADLARAAEAGEVREPPHRAAVTLVLLAAWSVVAVAVGAALFGYVPFALFLMRETIWIAVVAGALTLLLAGIDDIVTTVFSSESRFGRAARSGVGVRGGTIDQIGVLLSALLRVVLVLLAVASVLVGFQSDLGTMIERFAEAANGIRVGEVTIAPGAILRAIAVLVVALAAMRGVGRWLEAKYLPATALDAGARNSVATMVRYAGIILAVVWALASLGIGMERIALVLSALSVGIGFGLQAITQNFVSGLILLAERPVKIGDLVRIGDQEGDVKKISVRATEIQIADRSTLIVPNSELITKTIRNMTLSDPIGRIQILFAVPVGTDVGAARDILLAIYAAHPGVLDDPEPVVFIDDLAGGQVTLKSFAYVSGPRAAYPVRSAVLFEMLDRFARAGIHLETPAQEVRLTRPPLSPGGNDTKAG